MVLLVGLTLFWGFVFQFLATACFFGVRLYVTSVWGLLELFGLAPPAPPIDEAAAAATRNEHLLQQSEPQHPAPSAAAVARLGRHTPEQQVAALASSVTCLQEQVAMLQAHQQVQQHHRLTTPLSQHADRGVERWLASSPGMLAATPLPVLPVLGAAHGPPSSGASCASDAGGGGGGAVAATAASSPSISKIRVHPAAAAAAATAGAAAKQHASSAFEGDGAGADSDGDGDSGGSCGHTPFDRIDQQQLQEGEEEEEEEEEEEALALRTPPAACAAAAACAAIYRLPPEAAAAAVGAAAVFATRFSSTSTSGGGGGGLGLALTNNYRQKQQQLQQLHHHQLHPAERAQSGRVSLASCCAPPALEYDASDELRARLEELAPDEFRCPLGGVLMTEPVFTPTGITYHKPCVLDFIRHHGRDPARDAPLAPDDLTVNLNLRDQICTWLQRRGVPT